MFYYVDEIVFLLAQINENLFYGYKGYKYFVTQLSKI